MEEKNPQGTFNLKKVAGLAVDLRRLFALQQIHFGKIKL